MKQQCNARGSQTSSSIRRTVVGAAAVIAVALSSCGSDSDDSATVETFRAQANEICATGSGEIGAAVGSVFGSSEPTPEAIHEALQTIVSSTRRQLDEIEALDKPGSLDDEVAAMLIEARSATDEAEAQGLDFFEDNGDPWARTNELAAQLGLDVCATS